MQYFEDLTVGHHWTPGEVSVTAEEIRRFARRYDPQPFHLDPAAAERHFGGLIASGWHTAALCMRPFAVHVLSNIAIIAALGIDGLRWRQPVRPGDRLTVRVEVVGKDEWDEERGRVTFLVEGTNDRDVLVHDRRDRVLVERRNEAG